MKNWGETGIYRTKWTCKNKLEQLRFNEAATDQNQSAAVRRVNLYQANGKWQKKLALERTPGTGHPWQPRAKAYKGTAFRCMPMACSDVSTTICTDNSLLERPLQLCSPAGPALNSGFAAASMLAWRTEAWGPWWLLLTNSHFSELLSLLCRSKIIAFRAWKQSKEDALYASQ